MKRVLYFLLIAVISFSCKEEVKTNEEPKTENSAIDLAIGDGEWFREHFDFSNQFQGEFDGIFGDNRTAIKIVFESAEKRDDRVGGYDITGYSVHKENKVIFSGVLQVDKIFKVNNDQLHLTLSYEFREDHEEHGNGTFVGTGIGVQKTVGALENTNFIGEYIFPDNKSVLCNFK